MTVASRRHGDRVEITVRDNGIGFAPQDQERIFRVFERLHGRADYDGTGIGLALCRKIAERHGGTVSAEGEPGAGATFTGTLLARRRAGDGPPAVGLDPSLTVPPRAVASAEPSRGTMV